MNQQEPLEKEEFQTAQDSIEPVEPAEPLPDDQSMHHGDGLIEPIIKEYVPLEIGIVIFTILMLGVLFVGSFSNMWGLIE